MSALNYNCEVTNHRRIVYAETRASYWLAEGNRHKEAGRPEKAEEAYRLSQFWLDRLNTAEGKA